MSRELYRIKDIPRRAGPREEGPSEKSQWKPLCFIFLHQGQRIWTKEASVPWELLGASMGHPNSNNSVQLHGFLCQELRRLEEFTIIHMTDLCSRELTVLWFIKIGLLRRKMWAQGSPPNFEMGTHNL